jgi:hypothetical protein
MTEKYAALIKYKYLEYIDSAKLSDADAWAFMKSIIEYDKTGTEPIYSNPVLSGLFAVVKIDLDKNKENYEATAQARSEAGKEGAKKRWGKAKDNKNSKSQDDIAKMANAKEDSNCYDSQKNIAKMHDLDLVYVYEFEKEREKKLSPSFSKPDELNQNTKDLVSRIEGRRKKWESCKLPPAPIITNTSVLNNLKDPFETYADEKIDEAITNFSRVISQPGFDPSVLPGKEKGGGPPNFKNFLLTWVDRFIDEAKPFEAFKPKQGTSPPKHRIKSDNIDTGNDNWKEYYKGDV